LDIFGILHNGGAINVDSSAATKWQWWMCKSSSEIHKRIHNIWTRIQARNIYK